jgi:methyl-accepting chemotaxis protein
MNMQDFKLDGLYKSMHENVVELQKKLSDLDKVYQDISNLKDSASGIPKEFQTKFDAIVATSNEYMISISDSVKKYFDGNNGLLATNMTNLNAKIEVIGTNSTDFQSKIALFKSEIDRIKDVDLAKQFDELQKAFMAQTQKDVAVELDKIAQKTIDFQTKINTFSGEVDRISKVDLEKGFRSLQDTLSQIFQAIQGININLTSLSTTINTIANTINNGFNQLEKTVTTAKDDIKTQIKSSETTLQQKIEILQAETEKLKSSNKINQILMIVSLLLSIGILAILLLK